LRNIIEAVEDESVVLDEVLEVELSEDMVEDELVN
jgi:hypothetical protein